jgi:hypothetical protein
MKLGMYIMGTEPIPKAYFINSSTGLCVPMCNPPVVARQRLGKHGPTKTNERNNRKIVGRVIFYAVGAISKESLWVCISPYRW